MKRTRFIQCLTALATAAFIGLTTQASAADLYWAGKKTTNWVSDKNGQGWSSNSGGGGPWVAWADGSVAYLQANPTATAIVINSNMVADMVYVQDTYTLTMSANATMAGLDVSADLTLTVAGTSASTGTFGPLTLGAGSTLAITNTGANFTLGADGKTSTLADGAKLSFSGGKTYTLEGTFAVTTTNTPTDPVAPAEGENGFAKANITAIVVAAGTVTNNATWTLNGKQATFNAQDGTVTSVDHEVYDTYYLRKDTMSVSGIKSAAGTHSTEVTTVDLSGGTLTADAIIFTVNATGGSLAFVGLGGVDTINVNGDISVSGDEGLALGKAYKIAADTVVTFAEGLQLAGLSIVGEGGTKVTVQNVSGATVQYALNEQNALLSASEITMTAQAEGDVTVGNQVAAGTVKNESENGYTLTLGNGNSAVQDVIASKGNIIFHNMGEQAISLEDMTIGAGKQVGVYQGTVADTASEATVTIGSTLNAGGGTLLANLVLEAGSTLNLGGGTMNLGSELTLQNGLIQLDEATLAAIAALENIGDKHDLIYSVPDTELTYGGNYDGDWARVHFNLSTITDADYKIVAGKNVFAIEKVSNVPEPTTGTMGLLALCALAARRRRK